MIYLFAVITVLSTGQNITYMQRSPFTNEQICHEREANMKEFAVGQLQNKNLTEEEVRIETMCVGD